MTATHVEFLPSSSVDLVAPHIATKVALPAPDPDNPAVVVRNSGPSLVSLRTGSAVPSPFHAPGSITLHAGQTLLVTAPGWATADAATVQSMPGGVVTGEGQKIFGQVTTVTVTRGKTVERWLFGGTGVEVI